jgi:hypothetical protein
MQVEGLARSLHVPHAPLEEADNSPGSQPGDCRFEPGTEYICTGKSAVAKCCRDFVRAYMREYKRKRRAEQRIMAQ